MSALDVKKHGGLDRSWRLSCRALFWVLVDSVTPAKAPRLLESVAGAKLVKARVGGAVLLAAHGIRYKLLGGASALLAVGACCAGLGFRCDFAAEAAQCCCCFVLHGAANKTEPLGFVKRILHSPQNAQAD